MLKGKVVMVTGANSMVGRSVMKILNQSDCSSIIELPDSSYDLCDYNKCSLIFEQSPKIDYLIHLAGLNGNISLNMNQPAFIFGTTTQIALNVYLNAVHHGVTKVITPLTSCGYPPLDEPVPESMYLEGCPHSSIEAHGYARRFMFIYAKQLNKQHGNRFIFTVFNNLYGPNDRFNQPDRLKVCGTLIKRFCDAKKSEAKEVVIWGDGSTKREFMYQDDAAESLFKCLESYDDYSEPINIGWGQDNSIKELAELIKKIVGYKGKIVYDVEKPSGASRKILDVSKMKNVLKWEPQISLEEGIKLTADSYLSGGTLVPVSTK